MWLDKWVGKRSGCGPKWLYDVGRKQEQLQGWGILVSGLCDDYNLGRGRNQLNHPYKACCSKSTYEMHDPILHTISLCSCWEGQYANGEMVPALMASFPVILVLNKYYKHLSSLPRGLEIY